MNQILIGVYRNALNFVKPRNIKLGSLNSLLLTYNYCAKQLSEIEKLRL